MTAPQADTAVSEQKEYSTPYVLKGFILTLYEQYTNVSTKPTQTRSCTFQFNVQAAPLSPITKYTCYHIIYYQR